jgi:hypothetical protein
VDQQVNPGQAGQRGGEPGRVRSVANHPARADVLGGRSKRTFAACGEDDVVAAFDQRTAASLSDTAAAAGDDGVAQL